MSDVITPGIVAEGVLLVVTIGGTLGHAAWRSLRHARLTGRLEIARGAVIDALGPSNSTGPALAALAPLGRAQQLQVLARIGQRVTGEAGRRIAELTATTGIERRLLRASRSRLPRRRLHAARVFTATGSGREAISRLLDDPDPPTRAEAALWVVRHGDDDDIARVVAQAFDADGLSRFTAADVVVRLGSRSAPALAEALATRTGPALVIPLRIAGHIADTRLLGPVRQHSSDPEEEVRAQALSSVARIGGGGETALLESALHDEAASVRTAAVEGLGRLGAWRSALAIGEALRDPSWDVRRAAGIALRALDAPGLLVLRRALQDEDRFARDMAQRVLDEERLS